MPASVASAPSPCGRRKAKRPTTSGQAARSDRTGPRAGFARARQPACRGDVRRRSRAGRDRRLPRPQMLQFQQARAFLAQTSGKSGDGGPAPFANVQEPPSLGMIGISELPAIDAGSPEATGPDLPALRKVAGISKPKPTGSAGSAPEAWIPAGAAAPPRFTRLPPLPVPRPGAGLAAGPPSRPEASRASVPPPVLFDTSVASPPLPGSSLVYLNVPVTVSEEIAAAALGTLRAAGLGEVFLGIRVDPDQPDQRALLFRCRRRSRRPDRRPA